MTYLPPTLYTDEFAKCVRLEPATIRKYIRGRVIKARGKPYLIPNTELSKFGVTPEQALQVLSQPAA